MRFGLCTDLALIDEVEALGYDYIEAKLNALAALDDAAFEELCEKVAASTIKPEAGCLLFPKTMMIIRSGGEEEMCSYLEGLFRRMDILGIRVAVFGSGKSRFVPDGMNWQEAYRILVSRTRLIGEIAAKYGITVAIEPLNRSETNLINSLAEGAALQSDVALGSICLLADMYHMAVEGEDFARIPLVSPLAHTHVALKEGRVYPESETKELTEFFLRLKEAGYDGRMSIEGKSADWKASSVKALALLREIDRR